VAAVPVEWQLKGATVYLVCDRNPGGVQRVPMDVAKGKSGAIEAMTEIHSAGEMRSEMFGYIDKRAGLATVRSVWPSPTTAVAPTALVRSGIGVGRTAEHCRNR
jgi:hypothetical protein